MKILQILFINLLTYVYSFVSMNTNLIKTDIVVLTGSQIKKSHYIPIVNNIKTKLLEKDISANVYVIDSFFKENEIKNLIKNKVISKKFHILGHSFGSYEAGLYCKNNEKILSLIQICGNFNLVNQHPYSSLDLDKIFAPTLTILGELDDKLPVTDAILDKPLLGYKNKLIALDDFKHLSIIDSIQKRDILGDIISEYIHYIETNDKNSLSLIKDYENKTNIKFTKYIESVGHYATTKIAENAQDLISDLTNINVDDSVYAKNYSLENKSIETYARNYSLGYNLIEKLLQNFCSHSDYICYYYKYLPSFITSHPSNINNKIEVSAISPLKINLLSFFNSNRISNSEVWLKLYKKNKEIINPGKKIGEDILNDILQNLSTEEKQYRKKIVFENDIVINSSIPMCSVIWLCTPISITYTDTNIIVRVPVLQTPTEIPEYVKKIFGNSFGNSLNIKMLSESQMYEWILVKCKM